jgi:hypothetical protein
VRRATVITLSVATVFVVGLVAKLPETILPIATDTGMYATFARMMLHGARPYVDFYDIHPPLVYLYWMVVELIAGSDWSRICVGAWGGPLVPQPCISLLAHTFDLGLTFVTAWLVYAIARRLGLRPLFGLLAAVAVVWFANESMISMEGSTPTKLTLVPSTLAVYAYLRAFPTGHLGWAILAGGAAMLGVMAKQPALMTLFTLFACLAPGVVRGCGPQRRVLAGLGVGLVVVLVPFLAYLAIVGSLGGFLDQPWRYNLERLVVGYWQTPAGLTSPATRVDRVAGQSAGLLFVAALLGGLALLLGPVKNGQQRLLLVWGVFSLFAIAGFREFAQVVPSLALLAAVGIGRIWDAASHDGLGLGRPLAGQVAVVVVFGTIFVLTSSFQLVEFRRALYESGPAGKPSDPDQIASYLRSGNAPPGPILTWGNAAHIFALSGRDSSTRFLITEFPRTDSPRAAVSRQQLLDDLRAHPPADIVVDPRADEANIQLSNFPELSDLIARCYQRVPAMPSGWSVYAQTSTDCRLPAEAVRPAAG